MRALTPPACGDCARRRLQPGSVRSRPVPLASPTSGPRGGTSRFCPGTARPGGDRRALPLLRRRSHPAALCLAALPGREVLVRPSRWVWPRWVPTPARRFRTRQQVAFTNALRPIVRRRRSSGRLGDDMLGQMLRPSPLRPAAGRGHPRHSPRNHRRHLRDTFPGSRMDPAVPGPIPQAAGRVAAEAALLPADPAATTSTHLDGLQYTQALVREVLRLHPRAGC